MKSAMFEISSGVIRLRVKECRTDSVAVLDLDKQVYRTLGQHAAQLQWNDWKGASTQHTLISLKAEKLNLKPFDDSLPFPSSGHFLNIFCTQIHPAKKKRSVVLHHFGQGLAVFARVSGVASR